MKYAFPASLGLALLLATSCSKNDSDSPSSNRIDSVFTRKISDNTITGGAKYKYDNVGNLIQYFVSNTLVAQYKYDSQNRLTLTSNYELSRLMGVDSFVYSSNSTTRIYHYNPGVSAPQLADMSTLR